MVAHRGASGYRPEHTRASYELAVELGADFIEPDLVMTRDGVLVDRHEPDVSETTDIADHPELSERRRTKLVDGQSVTGWFTEDLTLTELRTLRARERLPELRSSEYDDRFGVLTFEECLQLRETLSDEAGRPIGIMPEVKHPTYLHDHGLDAATELVRLLRAHGLDDPQAPVWVQCFEPTFLAELRRRHGLGVATVLLTEAEGGPWDLRARSATYEGLLAPEGLAELARSVDGVAPGKEQVIPRREDGTLAEPTSLVRDAHDAGLLVVPWTFRTENAFLPTELRLGAAPAGRGDGEGEVRAFLEAGVDGLFCDHPDVGVAERHR
ncbi:glycerophosphodiester phosphodiesterase family protein [Janibacter corallicola]|uniref:glycerophosphodiester phosphodiesterase family protein n=1 Tax=Janibacter corallicola TaxID=415212 RepID=UPI000AC3F5EA|nr:glycerophosphodiester phosphodiesterase family protein [Janibacter corallicola]